MNIIPKILVFLFIVTLGAIGYISTSVADSRQPVYRDDPVNSGNLVHDDKTARSNESEANVEAEHIEASSTDEPIFTTQPTTTLAKRQAKNAWVTERFNIASPPQGSEPKLRSLEEFLTSKDLKCIQTLDEVPDEWKSVRKIRTQLEVPFIIQRPPKEMRTAEGADAADRREQGDNGNDGGKTTSMPPTVWDKALHASANKGCKNPELQRLVSKHGWTPGVKSDVNVSEWPFKPDLFTHAYILQVPWAFLGDNHVFGTQETGGRTLHFGMDRFWMTNAASHLRGLYSPNDKRTIGDQAWPGVRDLGEVAFSAESWQGDHFQHFVLDTLPRLSLLYEQMTDPNPPSEQEFLTRAKIVFNDGKSTRWFMDKLGLSNRTVNGIGWGLKANYVYRARLGLYPEYHQPPKASDPHTSTRHGVYPRGALLPIQRALGVLDPADEQDSIIYIKRNGHRSIRCDIEQVLVAAIQKRLQQVKNRSIKLVEFKFDGSQDRSLLRMRRALMVFGVHGGGMANGVLCRPGTAYVEIMPIRLMEKMKGRTSKYCYYGLAQAAGLEYWTVEPKRYDWGAGDIDPDPRDVLDILELTLQRYGLA
eukprot:m.519741 g.519741  ORF g.519741 m.519741 type:complete len:589 (+) comp21948_c0_seq11:166-1932(+)